MGVRKSRSSPKRPMRPVRLARDYRRRHTARTPSVTTPSVSTARIAQPAITPMPRASAQSKASKNRPIATERCTMLSACMSGPGVGWRSIAADHGEVEAAVPRGMRTERSHNSVSAIFPHAYERVP